MLYLVAETTHLIRCIDSRRHHSWRVHAMLIALWVHAWLHLTHLSLWRWHPRRHHVWISRHLWRHNTWLTIPLMRHSKLLLLHLLHLLRVHHLLSTLVLWILRVLSILHGRVIRRHSRHAMLGLLVHRTWVLLLNNLLRVRHLSHFYLLIFKIIR